MENIDSPTGYFRLEGRILQILIKEQGKEKEIKMETNNLIDSSIALIDLYIRKMKEKKNKPLEDELQEIKDSSAIKQYILDMKTDMVGYLMKQYAQENYMHKLLFADDINISISFNKGEDESYEYLYTKEQLSKMEDIKNQIVKNNFDSIFDYMKEEIKIQIGMCGNYGQVQEVLIAYGIINEDGKLNA